MLASSVRKREGATYADGTLGLPFFSKVSLQAAAERIAQFGIPLSIELIAKPASDDAAEEGADE